MKRKRRDLRDAVKAGEENGLQMLVTFFDWLDSLEPQSTTETVTRSQKREAGSTILLAPMDDMLAKKANNAAVSCSPGIRLLFFLSDFRSE